MPAKKTQVCDPVESVISDIRAGRMVIVTDDEDRENEGDLICAAESITPAMVNFMVREGGGMLCVPVSLQIAQQLNLESMVPENREAFRTDFTVTVDAAKRHAHIPVVPLARPPAGQCSNHDAASLACEFWPC